MTVYHEQAKMQIITINLPDDFILAIERILETGEYPSRSEVLRVAAKDQVNQDLQFLSKLHGEVRS